MDFITDRNRLRSFGILVFLLWDGRFASLRALPSSSYTSCKENQERSEARWKASTHPARKLTHASNMLLATLLSNPTTVLRGLSGILDVVYGRWVASMPRCWIRRLIKKNIVSGRMFKLECGIYTYSHLESSSTVYRHWNRHVPIVMNRQKSFEVLWSILQLRSVQSRKIFWTSIRYPGELQLLGGWAMSWKSKAKKWSDALMTSWLAFLHHFSNFLTRPSEKNQPHEQRVDTTHPCTTSSNSTSPYRSIHRDALVI